MKGLVPEDKSVRVTRFQQETVKSAIDLMASAGILHPDYVTRDVITTRIDRNKVETFAQTFPELETGCLLNENTVPEKFLYFWKRASVEKF
jgi:hypothetical protein